MERLDPRSVKRAGLLWVMSLVMFAVPHGGNILGLWDPLFHRAVFLILAPPAIAGGSLLLPMKEGTYDDSGVRFDSRRSCRSRSSIWQALGCCVFLALFLVFMLFVVNADAAAGDGEFVRRCDIVAGIALMVLAGLAVYLSRQLKSAE